MKTLLLIALGCHAVGALFLFLIRRRDYNHLEKVFIEPRDLERAGRIKVVCSWCYKTMRGDEDAEQTSHSICKSCRAKAFQHQKPQVVNQS